MFIGAAAAAVVVIIARARGKNLRKCSRGSPTPGQ